MKKCYIAGAADFAPARFKPEDGDLVIAFDKYQVAPGAYGCPSFTIPRAVYEAYLP